MVTRDCCKSQVSSQTKVVELLFLKQKGVVVVVVAFFLFVCEEGSRYIIKVHQ